MATEYKMFKLTALPGTLQADSIYFTAGPNAGELNLTVTGTGGVIQRSVISHADVDAKIASAMAGNDSIKSVADIAARDALTLATSGMVLVLDASSEGDVIAGAALYFYTKSTDAFTKVSEFESLELDWAHLKDKPSSTVGDIDDAVSKKHSHTETIADIDAVTAALIGNAADTLTDISEDGNGDLSFNGKSMGKSYFEGTPEW